MNIVRALLPPTVVGLTVGGLTYDYKKAELVRKKNAAAIDQCWNSLQKQFPDKKILFHGTSNADFRPENRPLFVGEGDLAIAYATKTGPGYVVPVVCAKTSEDPLGSRYVHHSNSDVRIVGQQKVAVLRDTSLMGRCKAYFARKFPGGNISQLV